MASLAPLSQSLSQFKLTAPAPNAGGKPPISAFQTANITMPAAPSTNAFSDAGDVEGQNLKNTLMVTQQLHNLITQGVPANDLRRMQLVNYLKTNQGVAQSGPVKSAVQAATGFVNQMPKAASDTLGNTFVKPFAQTAVSGYNAVKAAQDLSQGKSGEQDLIATRNLGPIIGQTQPFAPNPSGKDLGAQMQPVNAGFQMAGTVDLANSGIDALKSGNESAVAANQAKNDAASIDKLQETISPKITSKETQAIINEGRLTRGDNSVLFGKQPDIVTQSENVQQAAQVIHQQIPNASQMNDVQLSNALNSKITETAETLKPQMEATPVHPDTPTQMQDAWQALKTEQQSRPEFLDNKSGNTAFQGKFENYLSQVTDDKNMNDIWQARQAYDNSVPSNVKNATSASPPQFQVRKAMWLENRAILNSAINDTSTGLGGTSQQAFSDMSHMYDAQQNIAAKAKIDTTGAPGPLSKSTLLKWGVGAGATLFGLHKLGL
jgi:hypothetical protein